jgi:RNA polymerase primary sigma factor
MIMRKIRNHNLAQLLMQFRFTPLEKRQKQLESAEKLLAIIDKDKEYPFEFVCFHITGYHPKTSDHQMIKGDQLLEDLRVFIFKLSSRLARLITEQNQKVYTIDELAAMWGVSTKTISRWQKYGLVARKFIFNDGQKRFAFLQSVVDEFTTRNQNLLARANAFRRLTNKEKQQIIKHAMSLASMTTVSRHQVIAQIAAKMNRAHETIRYILVNYQKHNPDRPVFAGQGELINPAQAVELFRLYKQGASIKELMVRFERSKSSIYRIINMRRAKALLAQKIEFIASDEFLKEGAEEKILAAPISDLKPVSGDGTKLLKLAGNSLPEYLQTLRTLPVLNREREAELFRRYNYLKYLASVTGTGLKPARVSSSQLNRIEAYLAEAETIKTMIIEANLRLVVSIANKHTTSGTNLLDLVSEGNFSLMHAVEKFDYTRGFRFATYASWAIAKDYARKIPAEASRPDKAPTASLANIQRDFRTTSTAGVVSIERAHQSLVEVIRNELNEREQYVILNHFGVLGSPIKKKTKTLKQIGDELGLSKERVRQIELEALQKLRQSLSVEEFELLTG